MYNKTKQTNKQFSGYSKIAYMYMHKATNNQNKLGTMHCCGQHTLNQNLPVTVAAEKPIWLIKIYFYFYFFQSENKC